MMNSNKKVLVLIGYIRLYLYPTVFLICGVTATFIPTAFAQSPFSPVFNPGNIGSNPSVCGPGGCGASSVGGGCPGGSCSAGGGSCSSGSCGGSQQGGNQNSAPGSRIREMLSRLQSARNAIGMQAAAGSLTQALQGNPYSRGNGGSGAGGCSGGSCSGSSFSGSGTCSGGTCGSNAFQPSGSSGDIFNPSGTCGPWGCNR